MLDPSSSEEESDDLLEGDAAKEPPLAGGSGGSSSASGRSLPATRGSEGRLSGSARSVSPSPSVASEKEREEQERIQREEEDAQKRKALQLYVFLLRCIAYPFNAKQPTDMARRQQKVSECETDRESLGHRRTPPTPHQSIETPPGALRQ
ncbi:hypothetical protein scyTo_0006781 [Scyliorhinus torazame]|uniref:Uncharacterized protein n=1 Tax=Scyliorhinus torazame TaxID=75743 RepID=A0A401PJZ0_SCYTO|nr:hypothetical protein [Scyliorhinus torazame]